MKFIVYSKPFCSYCVGAKRLLNSTNQNYKEIVIGSDIGTDKFKEEFPNVRTVPHILLENVDGSVSTIGGFDNLQTWMATHHS